MRGERRRPNLALEIIPAQRLERDGVHGVRRTVLLAGEQHAPPEGDIGVGRGADDALDAFVVREGVAVAAEEAATGGGFV